MSTVGHAIGLETFLFGTIAVTCTLDSKPMAPEII